MRAIAAAVAGLIVGGLATAAIIVRGRPEPDRPALRVVSA